MIIMAIDHIRDYFDRYSMSTSPTDLSQTTAFMFFTRTLSGLAWLQRSTRSVAGSRNTKRPTARGG
jgi:hypothetical protein